MGSRKSEALEHAERIGKELDEARAIIRDYRIQRGLRKEYEALQAEHREDNVRLTKQINALALRVSEAYREVEKWRAEAGVLREALEKLDGSICICECPYEAHFHDPECFVGKALSSTPLSQAYAERVKGLEAVVNAARKTVNSVKSGRGFRTDEIDEALATLDASSVPTEEKPHGK